MPIPTWMLVPFYLGGVAITLFAANRLVKICLAITRTWGVTPLVLGSTVVAAATSLPEFSVVLVAVLAGKPDLAVGNVLGANILNIGLVLGISSTLTPLAVSPTTRRRELPLALGVLALFFLLALDSRVSRLEGVLMLAAMGGYLSLHLRTAAGDIRAFQSGKPPGEPAPALGLTVVRVLGAVVVLFCGGLVVVVSASALAGVLGISQLTIGVVLVAMSTTIPELAASASSAYHKEPEISLANVVGSNNFNILVCVGFVALLKPIAVNPRALRLEFPVAFAFYLLLLWFFKTHGVLSRREGTALLACYGLFVAWLLLR
ncbi:MAG: calcium/sodium antiporter [Candidatus Tectimicrobiota bacterium]